MATATRVFGTGDAGAAVALLCPLCSPGTAEGPAAPEGPELCFTLANTCLPALGDEQSGQELMLFVRQGLLRWPRAAGCRDEQESAGRGLVISHAESPCVPS